MTSLGEPPEDCRGFPASVITPGQSLYRIHRAENAPWWFSSDRLGRFNLDHPHGTCYLTFTSAGAFVEVFGRIDRVARRDVDARRLATLKLPGEMRLADCTSARAAGFRATAAIHSSEDYSLTHRWAESWYDASFDGVKYFCGYDPSQHETAVAIFGDAGPAAWPADPSALIPDSLLDEVAATYSLKVWPTP